MRCLLRGEASTQGRAPSLLPLRFLLCFYNLWLEAVQHSILSSVAVAVVQRGSRNNCVPCRGCLNCWNKLLIPPTPLPQLYTHTHACMRTHAHLPLPPSSHQLRRFPVGVCLLETLRSMRFTLVIIISQDITHTDNAEWNPLGHPGPPGLLQFLALFLRLIDIGWCLSETPPASQ